MTVRHSQGKHSEGRTQDSAGPAALQVCTEHQQRSQKQDSASHAALRALTEPHSEQRIGRSQEGNGASEPGTQGEGLGATVINSKL